MVGVTLAPSLVARKQHFAPLCRCPGRNDLFLMTAVTTPPDMPHCSYFPPSSPTVANTAAFIKSKKQQSFSRQLAAELSWVLVLAGLVWCTATSAHLGGATVAMSVMRLRVKPRHHRCGYTHHSQSYMWLFWIGFSVHIFFSWSLFRSTVVQIIVHIQIYQFHLSVLSEQSFGPPQQQLSTTPPCGPDICSKADQIPNSKSRKYG